MYEEWITENAGDPLGRCVDLTNAMVERFPELKKVRGHYYCPVRGERAHWWLVTPAGELVDPTKAQFPSNGGGKYVEWEEGAEEPIGKCANCGEYSYESQGGNDTVCGDACATSFMAYCNRPIEV